jgi:hypothetical protein
MAKKGNFCISYIPAQFVQYGKIRVKYDTAYYTNTPYDTSLIFTILAKVIVHTPFTYSNGQANA